MPSFLATLALLLALIALSSSMPTPKPGKLTIIFNVLSYLSHKYPKLKYLVLHEVHLAENCEDADPVLKGKHLSKQCF